MIIDKKRAPIIKKLFEEYATGLHSATSLLKLACDMGLVSKQPNYYKSSVNYQKKSFIHVNTILSMLRNLIIIEPYPKAFVFTESSTRGGRKKFNEMIEFIEKQKHKAG